LHLTVLLRLQHISYFLLITFEGVVVKQAFTGLKKHKYHIICAWVLLLCFVAGQYMVYAHQHNSIKGAAQTNHTAQNSSLQTLKEKCAMCDVMHHNAMVINTHMYFSTAVVTGHVFKCFDYNFTSIQLILAGGRAPPSFA
jgi:hypothetical protein